MPMHDKETDSNLKAQIDQLITQVRENEGKLKRLYETELKLVSSDDLVELLRVLLEDFKQHYNLDIVSIALVDENLELRRYLDAHDDAPEPIYLLDEKEAALEFNDNLYVGGYAHTEHKAWFDGRSDLGSVALLPLGRGNRLIGQLHLGSTDAQRYVQGMGTDFLQRLAAITAVCIENAINLKRLEQLGVTDTLTGISNRRYFDNSSLVMLCLIVSSSFSS